MADAITKMGNLKVIVKIFQVSDDFLECTLSSQILRDWLYKRAEYGVDLFVMVLISWQVRIPFSWMLQTSWRIPLHQVW